MTRGDFLDRDKLDRSWHTQNRKRFDSCKNRSRAPRTAPQTGDDKKPALVDRFARMETVQRTMCLFEDPSNLTNNEPS